MTIVLSGRTRTVVGFARVLAASNGQREMMPAHLIAGILHEGQNPVVAAFHSAGITLPLLQRDLGAVLHNCAGPVTEIAISSSQGEERLLDAASAQAKARQSPVIWVDHLFFAAVERAEPSLLQVLAKHGLTRDRVEEHLALIRPPAQRGAV